MAPLKPISQSRSYNPAFIKRFTRGAFFILKQTPRRGRVNKVSAKPFSTLLFIYKRHCSRDASSETELRAL
jgi:hypothetical protein